MAYKMYKLDFGWEIAVPEGWIMEKKELGSYIFYPDDPEDETTIYASVFHSETDLELTPERIMKETFEKSIPENAQEVNVITQVHCKAFFQLSADGIYRIGAGFFTAGELLSLNVYARGEEKAREAASGFSQIKFTRGRKNAV